MKYKNANLNDDKINDPINTYDKITKLKVRKKTIIMIIVIIILVVPLFEMFYYNNKYQNIKLSDNEEDESEELSYEEQQELYKIDFEEQKENINISYLSFDKDNNMVVLVENKNQNSLSNLTLYTIFFDGDNNPIDVNLITITFLEGNIKYYLTINDIPENFERYDFLITKDYFGESYYTSYIDDVSFETYEEKRDIVINGKNNSNNEIERVGFAVIYYDENGNILYVKYDSEYDIKKNKTFSITSYKPYDSNTYKYINYSSYDVVLIYAYSHND